MMSTDEKVFLTLIGPESVMKLLAAEVQREGVVIGELQPLDAMTDAVDAPLGPEEIKTLMEFATVALKLGAATIQFITVLKTLLARSEDGDSARFILANGKTNAEIVSVTRDTDPKEAYKAIADASGK